MTIIQNFTIYLHDSYLTEVLKIHVKIVGVPPTRKAIHTNLYYQLSWRVLISIIRTSLPGGQDPLFFNINAINVTTHCNQIPRQILMKELVNVLPNT
uniref:Uncharacterized protein n=1 Tax=Solanum lycopersicum TaxID=4081 RepID=A0A3Q7J650_SOLLC